MDEEIYELVEEDLDLVAGGFSVVSSPPFNGAFDINNFQPNQGIQFISLNGTLFLHN
jgi:hypothetical protein